MVVGPTPPGSGVMSLARWVGAVFDVAGVVAGVDDDRAGLDPGALDQFGAADRGDNDVGLNHYVGEVGGFGVAVGHRGPRASYRVRAL